MVSKVFTCVPVYLSWLRSSSSSLLCSVTVFRSCSFVCVWYKRHKHLPNTHWVKKVQTGVWKIKRRCRETPPTFVKYLSLVYYYSQDNSQVWDITPLNKADSQLNRWFSCPWCVWVYSYSSRRIILCVWDINTLHILPNDNSFVKQKNINK